jgi:sugar-specific transcriptional regulator TrmB
MLEKLQKIGLSKKESQIYLELAKLQEATANELSKKTSTQRTVVYNVLQQLIEKGFVNYIKKQSKRYYSISKPESLLSDLREKEGITKDLISELSKIKVQTKQNNSVEVYEGASGLKILFEEIRKAKDLLVLNATGKIFEKLPFSANQIVKDTINLGKAKVIAVQSLKQTEMAKTKLNIKYLPKEAENLATTFIFENKVIIQTLKEKPFLIRIENKDIYEGYKKDFEVLWNSL